MGKMARRVLWIVMAVGATWACSGRQAPATSSPASPRDPPPSSAQGVDPATVERVSPEVARARVLSGQALLVCAYQDARCAEVQLEGAIPFSALVARLPELATDQEIILYCD